MFACPVIPVRDTVVFPGSITPLLTSRVRTINAVKAVAPDRRVFVSAQYDASVENPGTNGVHTFGTLCRIQNVMQSKSGSVNIVLEGLCRAKVVQFVYSASYLEAEIEKVPTTCETSGNVIEALRRSVMTELEKYIALNRHVPQQILQMAEEIANPEDFADLTAAHLKIKAESKQRLLETTEIGARLRLLVELLAGECEMLEMEKEIDDEVQEKIKDTQRNYFLREKLKIVQDKLGDDCTGADAEELREKIENSLMPEAVKEKALRETERFSRMPAMSPEASVARTYIDWLLDLPWNKSSEDDLNIARAEKILNEDHYGLDDVKDRIVEYLAVRKLAEQEMRAQVLCFVGPPGVGKTSLGMSIARAMGRQFVNIALGGLGDEAEIRGHRRTYVASMPGKIIQKIKQAGTDNPVMLLDEIDKIGSIYKGDPSSALLEVLDPEQNFRFTDNFLEVPFDLSRVMFITTANTTSTIPGPLLDRMEIIHLPGYLAEEKIEIAKRHLLPKIFKEHGITADDMSISKPVLMNVIRNYTHEAGVRGLDRALSKIARKIAAGIAKNPEAERKKNVINNDKVEEYLGAPKLYATRVPKQNAAGTSIGLAWTEAGGEVLLIESAVMKGTGNVTFTGNLGNIMQESLKNSMAYIRSNAKKFGLEKFDWQKKDVHVHVPENAVPKDGPSAGITLALSICSSLTGRKIDVSYAMTGEMTLHGEVLPIGGVREKILAAKRLGLKKLIVPADNKNDVAELKDWIKEGLEIHYVSNFDEVAALALKK